MLDRQSQLSATPIIGHPVPGYRPSVVRACAPWLECGALSICLRRPSVTLNAGGRHCRCRLKSPSIDIASVYIIGCHGVNETCSGH